MRHAAIIGLVVLGIAACSPRPAGEDGYTTTDAIYRLKDGEQIAVGSRWVHICCDCALVHKVEIVYDEETGDYLMRWWRDEERTARLREAVLRQPQIEMPERPDEREQQRFE